MKRRKFEETEKPIGTWKTGLMIAIPALILGITIAVLAIKFGWVKYPFGF